VQLELWEPLSARNLRFNKLLAFIDDSTEYDGYRSVQSTVWNNEQIIGFEMLTGFAV
jgi:hypothetical protein